MKKIFLSISALLVLGAQSTFAQVAVVVNPKSSMTSIKAEEVASLFLGKTDAIPGLGEVTLIDQADGSGVRDAFYSKVTGKSGAQVKAAWARLTFSGKATPPKEVANSAEVKKLIAAQNNAIGYIEKSAVDSSVKALLIVD